MVDVCRDNIVEAVRADLLRRSELGITKYGTTLSDANYSHLEYLRHAYEEALDLANYLQGAMQTEKARLRAVAAPPVWAEAEAPGLAGLPETPAGPAGA